MNQIAIVTAGELPEPSTIGHPLLVKFIARSRQSQVHRGANIAATLACFDLDADTALAPFHRLGDGLTTTDDFYLHADPVSLYADMSRVFITGWGAAGISMDDVKQLSEAVKAYFERDGLSIETPGFQRWYLRLPGDDFCGFPGPHEALGSDIGVLIPDTSEVTPWKLRLNECQMLLHQLPVNVRLRAQGHTGINSLWFWGGGRLPPENDACVLTLGESVLLRGLREWSGCDVADDLDGVLNHEGPEEVLLELDADPEKMMNCLESKVLPALLKRLSKGTLQRIRLTTHRQDFELVRKDWRPSLRRLLPWMN